MVAILSVNCQKLGSNRSSSKRIKALVNQRTNNILKMNSEFCRLCIRKEKSRLINALSIPELCKSVKCFLGLEILATDKCSTFICRQCISIITESISYRNRVLFNQETIKEQLLLQLQLENVDIKTENGEEDDDCIIIGSEESYQDLNIQPISFLQSSSPANPTRPRLKRTARKSTTKLPMMVFPPTKKICTRRLKVVCRSLIQKDVAHVYLDIKTRRLLKLNGKLAVRRIERKQTKKQMPAPIENGTKKTNLSTRSNQSMLSGKVGASGGTSRDSPAAQLNSKTNQTPRVEPIKTSQISSRAYRANTSMEKQAVKSASVSVAEIGSLKVQSASEVIASQMASKPATGTPMDKKNRPNSEQLVPFSAVNQRQPPSSKELTSVEAIKIGNTKLPVDRIQSNALQPSSNQLVSSKPISKRTVPKETLTNLQGKFINIVSKSAGNLSVTPKLKTDIVLNSVGNLSPLSTAVTVTLTEPRNVAATQTPPTTTSPIVLSPNTSIPNLNYGVFRVPQQNIESIVNGRLPMGNGRSNVSTANSYHIPASIITSNNSNQLTARVLKSSSSMSSPSSPTVNSINVGHFLSENRVKILTVNELNTRANITQPAGCDISGYTGNYNACKLPIRISLSRLKNEMSMKLFDSRGNEVNYQTLTESEKEAVKIRLVSTESIKSINKAFHLCSPDAYTVELLKMFGLTVNFFKNPQV